MWQREAQQGSCSSVPGQGRAEGADFRQLLPGPCGAVPGAGLCPELCRGCRTVPGWQEPPRHGPARLDLLLSARHSASQGPAERQWRSSGARGSVGEPGTGWALQDAFCFPWAAPGPAPPSAKASVGTPSRGAADAPLLGGWGCARDPSPPAAGGLPTPPPPPRRTEAHGRQDRAELGAESAAGRGCRGWGAEPSAPIAAVSGQRTKVRDPLVMRPPGAEPVPAQGSGPLCR